MCQRLNSGVPLIRVQTPLTLADVSNRVARRVWQQNNMRSCEGVYFSRLPRFRTEKGSVCERDVCESWLHRLFSAAHHTKPPHRGKVSLCKNKRDRTRRVMRGIWSAACECALLLSPKARRRTATGSSRG